MTWCGETESYLDDYELPGWLTTSFSALTLLVGSSDLKKSSPEWPVICRMRR